MTILAPSLLAADFSRLGEMVKTVEKAGAQWLHLDIMDGHFVPNISFGPGVVKDMRSVSDMFFDVHLMISEPEKYIGDFKAAGADLICFHYEAAKDPEALLREIRGLGLKAGISVKPNTSCQTLAKLLPLLDLVLVMSVEPGFGGQRFMTSMLEKVAWLKKTKWENGYDFWIEIDGGINRETAKQAVMAGAEVLVAGTAVFCAQDINAEVVYYTTL